jgi:hypothetical protein
MLAGLAPQKGLPAMCWQISFAAPDLSRRYTGNNRIGLNISSNHSSRGYDRVVSDSHSVEDRGARADPHVVPYDYSPIINSLSVHWTRQIRKIMILRNDCDSRTYHNIVADRYTPGAAYK